MEANETIEGWVWTVTAAGRQQADCHQMSDLSADIRYWYLVSGSLTQHTYIQTYMPLLCIDPRFRCVQIFL